MLDRLGTAMDQIAALGAALLFGFFWAGVARGAWYADQIRRGQRKFAIGLLMLEAAMALLCTSVGLGVAEYQGWPLLSFRTAAAVTVLAWLGPNGVFALGMMVWQRRTDKQ